MLVITSDGADRILENEVATGILVEIQIKHRYGYGKDPRSTHSMNSSMVIYVNGDSNTAGAELDKTAKNFCELVAEKYNVKLVNQAISGASNDYILRTSCEFIEQFNPKLVIIGWTTWEREEWLYNNQYVQINASCNFLDSDLKQRYKDWVLANTQDKMILKGQEWHRKIYQFHNQLNSLDIPHIFFHSYFSFFVDKDNEQDWNTNFISPYNHEASYFWTLKNQGYIPTKSLHFGADGHAAWAKLLIDYIDKNAYLRKW